MAKKFSERKEAWFRIIVGIVTGIVIAVWKSLIGIIAVINWFLVVFSGKRNKELAEFSEYFNTELYRFSKYLTFVSNERPFPFTPMKRISKFQK
jgi:hypothetical protein